MSCDCRKGGTCADHLAEADLSLPPSQRVSSPAFYEERIRQLEEMLRTVRFAFADCMVAFDELDQHEVAERLRERWPEARQS